MNYSITPINKKFISIDKKHIIDVHIIEDIGWFQIVEADFQFPKTFFLLLKDCIDFFSSSNTKFIKQYIREDDLTFIKESSYIDTDDGSYVITTPINNFIKEMTNLLGFIPI